MEKDHNQPNKPFYEDTGAPRKRKRKRIQRSGKPELIRRSDHLPEPPKQKEEPIRLNRFIARAGVCSRRDADDLIANGEIKVNGDVITEMGVKILPGTDKVEYRGEVLEPQQFVYVLLNKPKNMITTMQDPMGRRIVLDAIFRATKERVYPVGRLDRNTTGLILLTNDGEMTSKMTHPNQLIKKIYQARLDKPLTKEHMNMMLEGLDLEDGIVRVDKIDYVFDRPKNFIGLEISSGKNRAVKRMFEHLGYFVMSLDRVTFGPLTKKGLPRGKWRKLDDREVGWLKML
ncbi:MAG: pseudouridine synthase [Bacteroidota bacterium]